jgi:hypothetical protein
MNIKFFGSLQHRVPVSLYHILSLYTETMPSIAKNARLFTDCFPFLREEFVSTLNYRPIGKLCLIVNINTKIADLLDYHQNKKLEIVKWSLQHFLTSVCRVRPTRREAVQDRHRPRAAHRGGLEEWGCHHSRQGSGQNTDKKENKIFLIYEEIQNGAVAKSYMTNGLLIYREIFSHFLIY